MRQLYPTLAVGMLWCGWINSAGSQTPAPDYLSSVADNTANMVPGPLPGSGLNEQPWSVNLLFGFPTGVRVQRALGDGFGRDWLVEGFAGLELIYPIAGGGIRRRFTPICGEHDGITVSPGVDVYVLYNTLHDGVGWFSGGPTTFGLYTADVELLWHHAFNNRCGGQMGVNLGAGSGFHTHGVVVPVASFIFGLCF